MDIYFILFILEWNHVYFVYIISDLPVGGPFKLLPIGITPYSEHFLLSINIKYSRVICAFPVPNLCICVYAQSLSHVWLFATLWTVAHQDLLSMGFSRQEYWREFSFPPPGYLPNPGIEPVSPGASALADEFFTTELSEKPKLVSNI